MSLLETCANIDVKAGSSLLGCRSICYGYVALKKPTLGNGGLPESNPPLTSVPRCLQGAEERKHRSGSGHGGQEAQNLTAFLRGPGPDWERRSGASQPDCETLGRHLV